MPDYRPPAYKYQQLIYGGPTGRFDCTAWVGAWLADAYTKGTWTTTGRAIRLASSEPVPQPGSPGLNQAQVDAAVFKLSNHKVDFDLGGTWTPKTDTAKLSRWHYAGRPMGIAVNRGSLIDQMPDLGAVDDFRGSHQIGLILDDGKSYLFDPLSRLYFPANLNEVWRAAGNLNIGNGNLVGQGYAYAMVGRDIVPSRYEVVIDPTPEVFWAYRVVDGRVTGRTKAHGISTRVIRDCTKAATYPYGSTFRYLVRVTEGGTGSLAKSTHPYVSPDASAIHYRPILP